MSTRKHVEYYKTPDLREILLYYFTCKQEIDWIFSMHKHIGGKVRVTLMV
jgi:hypothetical protein